MAYLLPEKSEAVIERQTGVKEDPTRGVRSDLSSELGVVGDAAGEGEIPSVAADVGPAAVLGSLEVAGEVRGISDRSAVGPREAGTVGGHSLGCIRVWSPAEEACQHEPQLLSKPYFRSSHTYVRVIARGCQSLLKRSLT